MKLGVIVFIAALLAVIIGGVVVLNVKEKREAATAHQTKMAGYLERTTAALIESSYRFDRVSPPDVMNAWLGRAREHLKNLKAQSMDAGSLESAIEHVESLLKS